jgi:membrane-associated phospholipid phosphatase
MDVAGTVADVVYPMALFTVAKVPITRRWLDVSTCVGHGVNFVISKVLKELIGQPRPAERCAVLGTCGKLGMPSTHSQFMAFAFWLAYARSIRTHDGENTVGSSQAWTWERALRRLLLLTAVIVSVARVASGHHTVAQVVAGHAVGAMVAAGWSVVERVGGARMGHGMRSRFS